MKLAYVAGPYRSKDGINGVYRNIAAAREVARELWLMGYAVICPHANTAFMDGPDTDRIFLDGDIVMLERCDLVVVLPGWENSEGTKGEIDRADTMDIPVHFWEHDRDLLAKEAR